MIKGALHDIVAINPSLLSLTLSVIHLNVKQPSELISVPTAVDWSIVVSIGLVIPLPS